MMALRKLRPVRRVAAGLGAAGRVARVRQTAGPAGGLARLRSTRRRRGRKPRGRHHTWRDTFMGSVIKKRRKRMAKKKHRKLLRKTRVARRKAGK